MIRREGLQGRHLPDGWRVAPRISLGTAGWIAPRASAKHVCVPEASLQ